MKKIPRKLCKIRNSENNNILTAETNVKNKPKIRIFNVSNQYDKIKLEEDIIKRNDLPPNSVVVVHQYKQRNSS